MANFLQKAFGLDPQKHSVRTEIVAGITTFLTMAYILAVNPSIFGALDGMPNGAVFTATALASIIATLVMAFYAKKPFALAPGMGLNAFFVYTVCLTMGHSWQFALTAVLIEGIIFVILTLTKVRSWILNAIPASLKNAIGAGIGLFIAFIGMQNAGLIVNSDATLVVLGDVCHGSGLLAIIGLVITGALVVLGVKGGILIGIIATALLGLLIKDPATGAALTQFTGFMSTPPSVAPAQPRLAALHADRQIGDGRVPRRLAGCPLVRLRQLAQRLHALPHRRRQRAEGRQHGHRPQNIASADLIHFILRIAWLSFYPIASPSSSSSSAC